MPHQGAPLAIWILMCLGLALMWLVTILAVRALVGGRAGGRIAGLSTNVGALDLRDSEPERGTLTAPLPSANRIRIAGADSEAEPETADRSNR